MIVTLKPSELTVGILKGVRNHGHYREDPTILFPPSMPPPFQTASQIKQIPLRPPTSYRLRTLLIFILKVYTSQTFSFIL